MAKRNSKKDDKQNPKNHNEENENFSSHDLSEEDIKNSIMQNNPDSENTGLGSVHDSGSSQQQERNINDPYLDNAKKMQEFTGKQGLGNVKVMRGDEDAPNADMMMGWHRIHTEDMPSGGRYYAEGLNVHIRAARAAEIRHWSTLNEQDLFDVDDKLNHIVQNCSKVQSDKRMMSWKDLSRGS